MRGSKLIVFLSLSIILCSCNNPLGNTYNEKTYLNDIAAMREDNTVAYEDIELLTKYIAVSKIAGNNLQGETYEEILDRIKKIRQSNNDESTQKKMEKESLREQSSQSLRVNLSEKKFTHINNKDCFIYTVTFENLSPKNIKFIVGSISLNDLLDREIKNIQILLDEPLRSHSLIKKEITEVYNNTNESDKHIRTKELLDLKVLWNPEKIIFEDGKSSE